jgi:hypothetical protein
MLALYKFGLTAAKTVFFQNQSNLNYFTEKGIVNTNAALLIGLGR